MDDYSSGVDAMLEQLLGKYLRLRAEFAEASRALKPATTHLTRLGDEIAVIEKALVQTQPQDEQTNDPLPGSFLWHR